MGNVNNASEPLDVVWGQSGGCIVGGSIKVYTNGTIVFIAIYH